MQDSRDVNAIAQMLLDTISDTTVCSWDSYKITSSDNDSHNILFTHRYKNSAQKINKLYSWTFDLANMNTQNDLLLHNAPCDTKSPKELWHSIGYDATIHTTG